MNLSHIKDTALKYSHAISTILDIDVVIIDSEYNIIAYTGRNVDNTLPITRTSLIGEVLHTGEVLIVENNQDSPICKRCLDAGKCLIKGVISVPIFFNDEIVGAVALLVPENKVDTIFTNIDPAVDFIQSMVDLISFKLKNIEDYERLKVVKYEIETIIDTVEDGLIAFSNEGKVSYYNRQFCKYLNINRDLTDLEFEDIFNHKRLKEIFLSHNDKMAESIYIEDKNCIFKGIVSKKTIAVNGEKHGTLLIFRSLRDSYLNYGSAFDKNENISFEDIKTVEPDFLNEISKAKLLAVTKEKILISSEFGLETYALARAIHNFSDRSNEKFSNINCANKSYTVLENEIFGPYSNPLIGLLNLTNQGTLLISNVDELPIYLQRRLLNIIKTGYYINELYEEMPIDIRFIFHTSKDLKKLVGQKKFSEELYYRIIQNNLNILPLRERPNDLPIFINNIIEELKIKHSKNDIVFSHEVLEMLINYSWPGNLIELGKTLDTIIFNSSSGIIKAEDVEDYDFYENKTEHKFNIEDFERNAIIQMINSQETKENIAKKMGISRATLYRKLKKYNIKV